MAKGTKTPIFDMLRDKGKVNPFCNKGLQRNDYGF